MSDPWVALEPGADPVERVRVLRHAHEAFTQQGTVARPVRSVVGDSWRRSARAGVGPEGTARVELTDDDLGSYRAEHPLARVMPLIRELLGTFASDGEHLLAVYDTQGRLLWVEGGAATRRRADGMNFVPGARWAESVVGTNAPGTAVALDRPVQVFAAEHFIRRVQPWTCAAAPVHDPRTGRVLGAVDITGGDGLAHPHSLGFVQAVARAAESQLALLAPPGASADTLELAALGRGEARLLVGGRKIRLSRRHSEIRDIHWVIAGGGSGPRHRPMDEAWVTRIRDTCQDAGVAFFFKQWDGRTPKAGGRLLEGRTWDQMPLPVAA